MTPDNGQTVVGNYENKQGGWLQIIAHRIRAMFGDRLSHSINHRIVWATGTIITLTVVAKLISAGKEMMLAYYFGTSSALDAFYIAFALVTFALTVVAGSFESSIVPSFIHVRRAMGKVGAYRLYQSAMLCGIIMLIVFALLIAVITPVLISYFIPEFDEAKRALTHHLLLIILPVLVAGGLSMIWSSMLNADEKFALAALSPALVPLTVMVVLVSYGTRWGVYGLAIGTVSGFIAQAIILAVSAYRRGIPLLPRWYGLTDELKSLMGQYIPLVAGAFLMCSTALVDQAMGALLGSGSVAVINYGIKVVSLLELAAVALGTAVLPYFSKMVADSNWRAVRNTLRTHSLIVLLISIPVTIVLMCYSEPIIRLLYERGAFTKTDTGIVSQVQIYYLLQIPFYAVGMVMVRLLSALKYNKALLFVSALNIVTNISFNLLFMRWMGIAGIALSTSCVYLISSVILFVIVRKKLRVSAAEIA